MGIKLKIHPLFIIIGIYFAFIGKVFYFLCYSLTCLMHEFFHGVKAQKLGYKLNNIQLMPYGAVISGDIEGIKYKDEIVVALFGPLSNFVVAIIFVALWWIFPSIYPYTEIIVSCNLALGLINLLPAFLLDGGRILFSTLCLFLKRKKAKIVVRIISIIITILLIVLFVFSIIYKIGNWTILLFAISIPFGAFSKNYNYSRIMPSIVYKNMKRGIGVKVIAMQQTSIIKDVFCIFDGQTLLEIKVFCGHKQIGYLDQERTIFMLENGDIYSQIGSYL